MKIVKSIKAVFRNLRKFLKNSFYRSKFIYTRYYEIADIDNQSILIQSYSGTSMTGNPYYLLEYLCENRKYDSMKKYVAATKRNYKDIIEYIKAKGFNNVEVIHLHSRAYCKALATSKYLINNVTFPTYFIKRDEQVYLNTWHGTPLKALGKAMSEDMLTIGNVQRNFLMCDYILAPNQFTLDIIRRDYMLDTFYQGKYLLNGYPRNHIFLDKERQNSLKAKLQLDDKKIFVYMPTWRGTHALRNDTEQFYYIMHMLIELDKNLNENSIVYVKEHNMSSLQIDFDQFEKIEKFPSEYETYEFLSIADCLITDYSSVMFDFANTGRKVVLYAYDEEEYLKDRGMYIDFNSLPFDKVYTSRDLVSSLNQVDSYEDYSNDLHSYIQYDAVNTIGDILDLMITSHASDRLNIIDSNPNPMQKQNVLIFTGALFKNGITSALKGILNNIDKDERNYVLTFTKNQVEKNKATVAELATDFDYIVVSGQKNFRISEIIPSFLYFRFNINTKYIQRKMKALFEREVHRVYPHMKFDYLIHYTGYERKYMNLFAHIDGKKMIYVHNNLIQESKSKDNIHMPSLKKCYQKFDKIVIIRESMKQELLGSLGEKANSKVCLAHNLNNYQIIQEKAKSSIEFDDDTECNVSLHELKDQLSKQDVIKFINIARFSKEKGLDNLIKAFEQYHQSQPKSYLTIIGGYGPTYEETLELAMNSTASHAIAVIKSISNPYPILNASDVFILSSHYEGLPMVIMEALILNKPVISTSIPGPKEFLEQGYGYLVNDSVDGLVEGMKEYQNSRLTELKPFDYISFNEKAIQEFEKLFD